MPYKLSPLVLEQPNQAFNNLGHRYSFNKSSNLVINFQIKKDPIFKFQGLDLFKVEKIQLKKALVKSKFKIKNIDESIVKV